MYTALRAKFSLEKKQTLLHERIWQGSSISFGEGRILPIIPSKGTLTNIIRNIYIYTHIHTVHSINDYTPLNNYKICIFLMIPNVINGKMVKLKHIKHILQKIGIILLFLLSISRLANFV